MPSARPPHRAAGALVLVVAATLLPTNALAAQPPPGDPPGATEPPAPAPAPAPPAAQPWGHPAPPVGQPPRGPGYAPPSQVPPPYGSPYGPPGYAPGYPPGPAPGYPPGHAPGYPPGYPPGHAPGYPPGYAPGYPSAHPYGYGPPPYGMPPPLAPRTMPYREGAPIPPGYALRSERNSRVALIGGLVFLGSYALTAIAGASLMSEPRGGERFGALFVPVAGPFITLATSSDTFRNDDAGRRTLSMLLVLDGVVQAAGAGVFIYGMASERKLLVRADPAAPTGLVPAVRVGPGAGSVRWVF